MLYCRKKRLMLLFVTGVMITNILYGEIKERNNSPILIDYKIISITKDNIKKLGLWDDETSNILSKSIKKNWKTIYNSELSEIINAQSILVTNKKVAKIRLNTKEYFPDDYNEFKTKDNNIKIIDSLYYSFAEPDNLGITFEVNPKIINDKISFDFEPKGRFFSGWKYSQNIKTPIFTEISLQTSIMLKSGEVFLIGGFNKTETDRQHIQKHKLYLHFISGEIMNEVILQNQETQDVKDRSVLLSTKFVNITRKDLKKLISLLAGKDLDINEMIKNPSASLIQIILDSDKSTILTSPDIISQNNQKSIGESVEVKRNVESWTNPELFFNGTKWIVKTFPEYGGNTDYGITINFTPKIYDKNIIEVSISCDEIQDAGNRESKYYVTFLENNKNPITINGSILLPKIYKRKIDSTFILKNDKLTMLSRIEKQSTSSGNQDENIISYIFAKATIID